MTSQTDPGETVSQPQQEPTPAPQPPAAPPGPGSPGEPNPWGEAPAGPPAPPPPAGPPQYGAPQYGTPRYGTPQYGAPQYGTPQYGTPQYGAPQYGSQQGGGAPGQYGAPSYGAAGWRPAPVQRGVVPLRPLGLGEIFDGAFRSVRHNPRVMFGLSAIVISVMVLLQTVLQWYAFGSLGELLSTPVDQQDDLLLGDVSGMAGATLLSVVLSVAASTLLTGLLIVSVSRSVIGERLDLSEAWRRARPQLLRLVGLTLVVLVAILVVPALWVAGIVGAAVAEQWGLLVVVALLGGLGALAWVGWISVRTLLATPALMLEEQGVRTSLRRGWALSRGSFWRLLGIYLLTSIITGTVASIIVSPISFLIPILGMDPIGDPRALVLQGVTTILATVLTTPFVAAVVALLYIDLRIRREGLDVELARAAEQAAADGATGTAAGTTAS